MDIDYIVSYIDFNLKEILDLYKEVVGEEFNMDRNYTYLDFCLTLKLILKNLPFIHKLYITCKDILKLPDDVEELILELNGKIVRVNESEFMPNNYITFSAGCIEMFIWKIPGLSEHFIYGNDDMIPLKELKVEDFFINGIPTLHIAEGHNILNSIYCLRELNNINLVFDRHKNDYDYSIVLFPEHSLKPFLKSICEECYNKYKSFIMPSITPIRYFNNFNIDLYILYTLKLEKLINRDKNNNFRYLPSSDIASISSITKNIIDNKYNNIPKLICLNDDIESLENLGLMLRDIKKLLIHGLNILEV